MSVFKCKMCGGTIEFNQGETVGVCDSCGTKQTLPHLDDDKKANLYDRANHFRRNNDFDKAMGIYEQILNEDSTDAEAYWSLVLCRYGIEYVEDPTTHKRVPTINRTQYSSIFSDEDYKSAINYSDIYQRTIYEDEAKAIDDIQKGILEISQKEEPFDVFICYKETDANGRRTPDSVLANDLYHQLTQEGFKVFFSRITLEDKLGTAYEPYIFAALNSSKVMVVLGTKPEYFNAVWVKNEWSRYLALVKNSLGKKMLIPAYKDMDPYDLPEEFSHLQAQDMSKLGFMQDLIRGVKKIIGVNEAKKTEKETVVIQQATANTTANAQIKRGNMALEDHDYEKADSFFEEALNLEPECAEAYIGKMLARDKKPRLDSWVVMQKEKYAEISTQRLTACPENTEHIKQKAQAFAIKGYLKASTIEELYIYGRDFDSSADCRINQKEKIITELKDDHLLNRARQYAKGDTKKQLDDAIASVYRTLDERISKAQGDDEINIAQIKAAYATHIIEADKKAEALNSEARKRGDQDYDNAVAKKNSAQDISDFWNAQKSFEAMQGYRDSEALAQQCKDKIEEIKTAKEKALKEAADKADRMHKKVAVIALIIVAICAVVMIIWKNVFIPNSKFNSAVSLMNEGKYEEAISAFEGLDGYKNSEEQIKACKKSTLISSEIGDYVCFGSYEQDNDNSNGKEDIEWIVLAKENDSMLLISKYAIDCQQYNASYEDVTWSACSLRAWLNGTFIDTAFTDNEKEKILTTTVTADKNSEYSTDAGNDTRDKIFLLSTAEAEKYFSNDSDRQCEATSYAEAQGAYISSFNGNCWWWLRSPGNSSDRAAYVDTDGLVRYLGAGFSSDSGCVRPALWINIES